MTINIPFGKRGALAVLLAAPRCTFVSCAVSPDHQRAELITPGVFKHTTEVEGASTPAKRS